MWPNGGLISGLLFETGLVDNSPLRAFLKENLKDIKPKRKLLIGATNIDNGELIRYNETSFANIDEMIEGIVASAAIPVIFPFSELFGSQLFDGGLAFMLDIPGSIDRCHKDGYNDSQIILDMVLVASNDSMPFWGPGDNIKAMQVYNRE